MRIENEGMVEAYQKSCILEMRAALKAEAPIDTDHAEAEPERVDPPEGRKWKIGRFTVESANHG